MLKGHAEYCLAMNCYYGIGERQDHLEAASHFQAAALLGHAEAQSSLGWLYLHGDGVPRYLREAFRWFRAAAENGSADGMCRLALLYASGQHVEQSWTDAALWFNAAAEKGHAESMYYLALIHILGSTGTADSEKGVYWMRQSALGGFADAAYALGCMYKDGKYIARSTEDAIFWLEKAAGGKQVDAALLLGAIYEVPGERLNPARSRAMYLTAARLGSDEATNKLASMYMQTTPDIFGAMTMMPVLADAADRGHAEAAYVMGCFFQGLNQESRAESYFSIAEHMGSAKAKLKRKWVSLSLEKDRPLANIARFVDKIPAKSAKGALRVSEALGGVSEFAPSATQANTAEQNSSSEATAVRAPNTVSAEESENHRKVDSANSIIHRLYSVKPIPGRSQAPIIKWMLGVRNHRDAQLLLRLAIAYYDSENRTEEELSYAFAYFLRSAELGNGEAAYRVARMYEYGEGVALDLEKSTYWMQRAEAQHYPS